MAKKQNDAMAQLLSNLSPEQYEQLMGMLGQKTSTPSGKVAKSWQNVTRAIEAKDPTGLLRAIADHMEHHSQAPNAAGQKWERENPRPGSMRLTWRRLVDTPAGVVTVDGPKGLYYDYLAVGGFCTTVEEMDAQFEQSLAELANEGYRVDTVPRVGKFFKTPTAPVWNGERRDKGEQKATARIQQLLAALK